MLSVVKTIGNILWFCIAGLWLSLGYAFAAVVMTLLVVTAPFGIASWRLATYVIWPFGRSVVSRPGAGAASTIGNVLWFVLARLWIAISHVISGVLLCYTIIGIPFGIVSFRLAGLALAPLGKDIVKRGTRASWGHCRCDRLVAPAKLHTPTGTAPTYLPAIRVARPSRSRSFRSSGSGSSARATDLSMWTFGWLDRRLRELFASVAHRRLESGPELTTQSDLPDVGRDHQRREPDTVDVGRPVG